MYNAALKDDTKKVSSKRVAALLLVSCFVIVILSHTYFEFTIKEHIFDRLADAVIWSLGFVGSEKIVRALPNMKSQKDKETEKDMI